MKGWCIYENYSVVNSKGGVGKSTISVHLGHALARAGKRTLIVDMDMQDNIRSWFDVEKKKTTLFEVLMEGRKVVDAAVNVREGLDIISSGGDNLGAVPFLLNLRFMLSGLSGADVTDLKDQKNGPQSHLSTPSSLLTISRN